MSKIKYLLIIGVLLIFSLISWRWAFPDLAEIPIAPTITLKASPTSVTPPMLLATLTPDIDQPQTEIIEPTPRFKSFSADEFINLFFAVELPNLEMPAQSPTITGDIEADNRIRFLAESRGYRKQKIATGELSTFAGQQMYPQVATSWNQMIAAAAKDNIQLGLVSGYRSVEVQKNLFISRLEQQATSMINRMYSNTEIALGNADAAINLVLSHTAAPGYSKHHTGYTLDINDLGAGLDFTQFGTTAGYTWIAVDNFSKAKEFGFIPSYPIGASNAGPQPEAWEFTWVGIDVLKNN